MRDNHHRRLGGTEDLARPAVDHRHHAVRGRAQRQRGNLEIDLRQRRLVHPQRFLFGRDPERNGGVVLLHGGAVGFFLQARLPGGAGPREGAHPGGERVARLDAGLDVRRLDQLVVEQPAQARDLLVELAQRRLVVRRVGHRPEPPDVGAHHGVLLLALDRVDLRLEQGLLGQVLLPLGVQQLSVQLDNRIARLHRLTDGHQELADSPPVGEATFSASDSENPRAELVPRPAFRAKR